MPFYALTCVWLKLGDRPWEWMISAIFMLTATRIASLHKYNIYSLWSHCHQLVDRVLCINSIESSPHAATLLFPYILCTRNSAFNSSCSCGICDYVCVYSIYIYMYNLFNHDGIEVCNYVLAPDVVLHSFTINTAMTTYVVALTNCQCWIVTVFYGMNPGL